MVGVASYTKEQIATVLELRRQGKTNPEIAEVCLRRWPKKDWKANQVGYIHNKYKDDRDHQLLPPGVFNPRLLSPAKVVKNVRPRKQTIPKSFTHSPTIRTVNQYIQRPSQSVTGLEGNMDRNNPSQQSTSQNAAVNKRPREDQNQNNGFTQQPVIPGRVPLQQPYQGYYNASQQNFFPPHQNVLNNGYQNHGNAPVPQMFNSDTIQQQSQEQANDKFEQGLGFDALYDPFVHNESFFDDAMHSMAYNAQSPFASQYVPDYTQVTSSQWLDPYLANNNFAGQNNAQGQGFMNQGAGTYQQHFPLLQQGHNLQLQQQNYPYNDIINLDPFGALDGAREVHHSFPITQAQQGVAAEGIAGSQLQTQENANDASGNDESSAPQDPLNAESSGAGAVPGEYAGGKDVVAEDDLENGDDVFGFPEFHDDYDEEFHRNPSFENPGLDVPGVNVVEDNLALFGDSNLDIPELNLPPFTEDAKDESSGDAGSVDAQSEKVNKEPSPVHSFPPHADRPRSVTPSTIHHQSNSKPLDFPTTQTQGFDALYEGIIFHHDGQGNLPMPQDNSVLGRQEISQPALRLPNEINDNILEQRMQGMYPDHLVPADSFRPPEHPEQLSMTPPTGWDDDNLPQPRERRNEHAEEMRKLSGGPIEADFNHAQPMHVLNNEVPKSLQGKLQDKALFAESIGIEEVEKGGMDILKTPTRPQVAEEPTLPAPRVRATPSRRVSAASNASATQAPVTKSTTKRKASVSNQTSAKRRAVNNSSSSPARAPRSSAKGKTPLRKTSYRGRNRQQSYSPADWEDDDQDDLPAVTPVSKAERERQSKAMQAAGRDNSSSAYFYVGKDWSKTEKNNGYERPDVREDPTMRFEKPDLPAYAPSQLSQAGLSQQQVSQSPLEKLPRYPQGQLMPGFTGLSNNTPGLGANQQMNIQQSPALQSNGDQKSVAPMMNDQNSQVRSQYYQNSQRGYGAQSPSFPLMPQVKGDLSQVPRSQFNLQQAARYQQMRAPSQIGQNMPPPIFGNRMNNQRIPVQPQAGLNMKSPFNNGLSNQQMAALGQVGQNMQSSGNRINRQQIATQAQAGQTMQSSSIGNRMNNQQTGARSQLGQNMQSPMGIGMNNGASISGYNQVPGGANPFGFNGAGPSGYNQNLGTRNSNGNNAAALYMALQQQRANSQNGGLQINQSANSGARQLNPSANDFHPSQQNPGLYGASGINAINTAFQGGIQRQAMAGGNNLMLANLGQAPNTFNPSLAPPNYYHNGNMGMASQSSAASNNESLESGDFGDITGFGAQGDDLDTNFELDDEVYF